MLTASKNYHICRDLDKNRLKKAKKALNEKSSAVKYVNKTVREGFKFVEA